MEKEMQHYQHGLGVKEDESEDLEKFARLTGRDLRRDMGYYKKSFPFYPVNMRLAGLTHDRLASYFVAPQTKKREEVYEVDSTKKERGKDPLERLAKDLDKSEGNFIVSDIGTIDAREDMDALRQKIRDASEKETAVAKRSILSDYQKKLLLEHQKKPGKADTSNKEVKRLEEKRKQMFKREKVAKETLRLLKEERARLLAHQQVLEEQKRRQLDILSKSKRKETQPHDAQEGAQKNDTNGDLP